MLIVVLFGFLNIKSVKIYAIPFIFWTTLLLYKLYILLLKQKNLPVLDIKGFFFRIRTQVTALVLRTSAFTWVLMRKKKPVISKTGRFFCFNSTVSYTYFCSYHYIQRYIFSRWNLMNIFIKERTGHLEKIYQLRITSFFSFSYLNWSFVNTDQESTHDCMFFADDPSCRKL